MSSHRWTGAREQWTLAAPRQSSTKKFGSVLLVGAAVTGGVAATAGAASAAEPGPKTGFLPTTQTMTNAKQTTVRPHAKVQFSGNLTGPNGAPVSGEKVELQWKVGSGTWQDGLAVRSDAKGHVVASGQVATTSQWRFSYAGNTFNEASSSAPVSVQTAVPKPPAPPRPSKAQIGQRIVAAAASQAGKPYVYGASGPRAYDCSGLTMYAYRQVGIHLPHSSSAQASAVQHVSRGAAMPGDLLFFYSSGGHVYHTAIYAGHGKMWAAPQTGDVVKLQNIYSNNYMIGRGF